MASAQAQMRDVALAQVGTRTVTLASPDTKAREKWAPGTRIRACARITCSQTLNTGTGPAWLQAKELSDDTAGLLGRAAEFQQAEARLPCSNSDSSQLSTPMLVGSFIVGVSRILRCTAQSVLVC